MTRATAVLTAVLAAASLALGVGGAASRSLADTIVVVQVIGAGTVTDSKNQLRCGNGDTKCYATYTGTGSLTLTETPASTDWTFTSWSGDCSGTSNTCTLTLDGQFHEATVTYS